MKVQRLDHFAIEVGDLERAQRFYTEVLGLPVVMRLHNQVLFNCGDQNLALFEVPRVPLEPNARQARIGSPLGKGHHAFRVNADDFATARERLSAAGVESAAPIDWGDHDCLYFLDPDGNLLELINYR
jgi:catechol 2,3-dioxygenase-like lactoylglutathione lyase family enzyme